MFGNEKVSRRRTLIVRAHYMRDKSTVVRAADAGPPLVGTFQFSDVLGDGPIRVHFHRLYDLAENVPMNRCTLLMMVFCFSAVETCFVHTRLSFACHNEQAFRAVIEFDDRNPQWLIEGTQRKEYRSPKRAPSASCAL